MMLRNTCQCFLIVILITSLGNGNLSADKPEVPENAGFVLSTDKEEYFLGENVLLHFKLENTGGDVFKAEYGGDYRGAARALRFKVTATNQQTGEVLADPYPSDNCMGGPGETLEITPEIPFYSSLPIMRYARFDRPGTYKVEIHHDFGWEEPPMDGYPKAEIVLRFKRPTEQEAAGLIKKWIEDGEYGGSTMGEKAQPHADFSQIRYGEYLPALIDPAKEGNKQALIGIGSIESVEATRVLIDIVKSNWDAKPLDKTYVHNETVACSQLCMRLPDPYLQGELEKRNPFEDGMMEPRRRLVETSWDDKFSDDIRKLAVGFLESEDKDFVATGAYMLECIGSMEDAPPLIAALDREVEKTRSMKVRMDIYPRPRGACMELQRAASILLKRGMSAPTNPESPGQCILFAMELKRNDEFRPEGWLETCSRILDSQNAFVQEQVLKNLPQPMPKQLRSFLERIFESADIDLRIEACHIVRREKLAEFRRPILEILKTANEDWLFSAADNAAIALDCNYQRIEILVARLDQVQVMFKCLESLKTIFSNTGGGGWNSNIDMQAEGRRIKPHWEKFIFDNAEDLKSGRKYELPDPKIQAEMFPEEFTMTLKNGTSWPERE